MTDREVMQMALVQMGKNQWFVADMAKHVDVMAFNSVMQVLRAQLEQPEQAPVAYCKLIKTNGIFSKAEITWMGDKLPVEGPLYTHQPQRKPLTHEQAKALVAKYGDDPLNLVFQTEAAHGIKETS